MVVAADALLPKVPEQHEHRNIQQIAELIRKSKITEKAKQTAIAVFDKLAQAEAVIHNKNVAEIHFHEIGAVDSIADIVAACVGLDALGIDKVYCSRLAVGGGTVKTAHGLLPVPAPATAELLKGIPIVGGPAEVELLTPTAAAILTTITGQFGALPPKQIEAAGKEGQEVIGRAVKTGEEVRQQAQQEAKNDAESLITRARTEIQRERDDAIDELRKEFADLTILAAGKVIKRSLDKKAHRELIDETLEESETLKKE